MARKRQPDPRCTFAIAAYLSLFAVFVQSPATMGALLAISLAAAAFIGVSLKGALIRLKRLWQVIVFVALMQSLFSPAGTVWLSIGAVPVLTSGGAARGLVVLGRLTVLVLGGSLFSVYGARELIAAMIKMRMPYEIAYMISVGIRFVPQMSEELRDNLNALALRGVEVKELKLRKRVKVYTYLFLPAIAASLHNAKALSMSMEMRGFGAYPHRTSFLTLKFKLSDYILLAATALLAALSSLSL